MKLLNDTVSCRYFYVLYHITKAKACKRDKNYFADKWLKIDVPVVQLTFQFSPICSYAMLHALDIRYSRFGATQKLGSNQYVPAPLCRIYMS